jgi:glutamine amidotransferase
MITIIDYGAGNIKSVKNILKRIGEECLISNKVEDIANAKKLIIPGVGHFDYGMNQLKKSGLIQILNKRVLEDKVPVLGICLGAQLLGNGSEEGQEKGLGWIEMEVVKFDECKIESQLKIPHMNWSELKVKKDSYLFSNFYDESRFYFVHSFHMNCFDKQDVLATCNYGYEFDAAVEKGNIYGVQFHPEKSHKFGMKLLENFSKI